MSSYKRQEGVYMGKNLITKAEYKTYAGISSTNQDSEIDLLIPKISELIKTYCRRTFVDYYDEPLVEKTSGGFEKLLLKEAPVVQVLSLEKSTDYGQTYANLTEFSDWVLDTADGSVVALSKDGFPKLVNGYIVTYFAGYETVPEDLKLAALDLVTYYRKNDGSVHNNKSPGAGGSVQLEYIMNTNFPAHIKRVLDQYVADYT
jgi:hypothetical protein